ncbi:recombinase family protein [Thalassovita sp.]|uniref:recombinase family protein n=1 Tax=Thalassovita sp. TaxID=1979401 RepID=UPI002B26BC4F|nr:recombinase family protein [Thalassovita sp.]
MKVGYRRVSTEEQNLDRQDLSGVEKIFEEKVSGATRDRPALAELIAFVRDGDHVVIHSIDRLARDLRDLQNIVEELNAKGVEVEFIHERLLFSNKSDDPMSRFQLHMMGAFAEFERSIIKKRQAEGIAKAKARGAYKGRKRSIDPQAVKRLKDSGMPIAQIARTLNISRMSVYRNLD